MPQKLRRTQREDNGYVKQMAGAVGEVHVYAAASPGHFLLGHIPARTVVLPT